MRGAWNSALVAANDVMLSSQGEREALSRYSLAVFAAWLKAVGPAVAASAGRAARQAVDRLPADEHAEEERLNLVWLDGLLAVVRHDRRTLDAARATVHLSHAPAAQYVERSLWALSYKLDGATARLGDSLEAADRGEKWDEQGAPFRTQILSINRLTEADAFLATGDTARAAKLLLWHEAELNGDNLYPQIFAPSAYLQLAQIEEAQGQTTLAREHYEQFLRRYDRPVAALQPPVDQARAALARLSTKDRHHDPERPHSNALRILSGRGRRATRQRTGCGGGTGGQDRRSRLPVDPRSRNRSQRPVPSTACDGTEQPARHLPDPVAPGRHLHSADTFDRLSPRGLPTRGHRSGPYDQSGRGLPRAADSPVA